MVNTNPRSGGRFTSNAANVGNWGPAWGNSVDIPIFPVRDYLRTSQEWLDDQAKALKKHNIEVKNATRHSVMQMRAVWGMYQGMVRTMGGTISMTQRLVISSILGGIQTLYPLLTATESLGIALKSPSVFIPAAMGLLEVGTAVAALIAYQNEANQLSLQIRGANYLVQNMSNLLSMWY